MKKLLITVIAAVAFGAVAFAQTTATTPSQDLKIQLKDSRIVGEDV